MHAVKLKLFFFLTRFCEQTHCLFLDTKEETIACFSDPFFLTIPASLKKHSHIGCKLGGCVRPSMKTYFNDVFSQILY